MKEIRFQTSGSKQLFKRKKSGSKKLLNQDLLLNEEFLNFSRNQPEQDNSVDQLSPLATLATLAVNEARINAIINAPLWYFQFMNNLDHFLDDLGIDKKSFVSNGYHSFRHVKVQENEMIRSAAHQFKLAPLQFINQSPEE